MNNRERFRAIMNYEPFDRLPLWFFGVWHETDDYRIVRDGLGAVKQVGKGGSSIPHTIEHAFKPTRNAWEEFKNFPIRPTRAGQ